MDHPPSAVWMKHVRIEVGLQDDTYRKLRDYAMKLDSNYWKMVKIIKVLIKDKAEYKKIHSKLTELCNYAKEGKEQMITVLEKYLKEIKIKLSKVELGELDTKAEYYKLKISHSLLRKAFRNFK